MLADTQGWGPFHTGGGGGGGGKGGGGAGSAATTQLSDGAS
jgi:hypothetical protein